MKSEECKPTHRKEPRVVMAIRGPALAPWKRLTRATGNSKDRIWSSEDESTNRELCVYMRVYMHVCVCVLRKVTEGGLPSGTSMAPSDAYPEERFQL